MVTIDGSQVLELLDQAVQMKGSDHRNPSNWNFDSERPCCLVGTALSIAGFTAEDCHPGVGVGSTIDSLEGKNVAFFTEEARSILVQVQMRADNGSTWGSCVTRAREVLQIVGNLDTEF